MKLYKHIMISLINDAMKQPMRWRVESTRQIEIRRRVLFLVGISGSILLLDQWTKSLIHSSFRLGESVSILEPVFSLTYVRNYGAAFGFLARAPEWLREPFFLVFPSVASVCIFGLYLRKKEDEKLAALSLALVLGGALGNLSSRLKQGYVVDFLDLHWKALYHWPAFNLADCAIVAGVALLFVESLFRKVP